jgi:hypothetical protein
VISARRLKKLAWYFLAAVSIATLLGTIVQTQFNIAAIAGLGIEISWRQRIAMTFHDLGSFMPIYGAMVAVTLLFTLPVAARCARAWPRARPWCFLAAGAFGILVAFQITDAAMSMPTFIAATRGPGGLLTMMASAALGSAAFGRLSRRRRARR